MASYKTKKKQPNRLVVLIGSILAQLGLGTVYAWSLFNQSLANELDAPIGKIAMTFSILGFALSFSTLLSGKLQDKFGIKRVVIACGVLLGLGLIISAFVQSLTMLYIFAGVVVGAADGIAYMLTLSNALKWYPDKKGLVSGISVGAYGAGSLLFKYLGSAVLSTHGVSVAFVVWGVVAAGVICLGALLLKDAVMKTHTAHHGVDFNVRQMLHTKQAYLLFIALFATCMSGLYLISIVKDAGMELAHLSAIVAADAVALVAICNTAGRIILGALSDKMKRTHLVAVSLLATAAAAFVLRFLPLDQVVFFSAVSVISFCFGGNITVFPTIVGEYFGLDHQAKNYSVIYQGFGLGSIAGGIVGGIIGGFAGTFVVVGVCCLIGACILFAVKPPIPKHKPQPKLAAEKR